MAKVKAKGTTFLTKSSGNAPVCEDCDKPMKPSLDSDGKPIWICPMCLKTKPRFK